MVMGWACARGPCVRARACACVRVCPCVRACIGLHTYVRIRRATYVGPT